MLADGARGRCREVEEVVQREVDGSGNTYLTVAELQQQEAQRRAGGARSQQPQRAATVAHAPPGAIALSRFGDCIGVQHMMAGFCLTCLHRLHCSALWAVSPGGGPAGWSSSHRDGRGGRRRKRHRSKICATAAVVSGISALHAHAAPRRQSSIYPTWPLPFAGTKAAHVVAKFTHFPRAQCIESCLS